MLRYAVVPVLCVVGFFPASIAGQSSNAFAGWASLVTTPVGAFAPTIYVAPSSRAERRWGAQVRYGHWQFASDDDNTTNLGVGFAFPAGAGRLGIEVGRTTKKECADCDAWMLGGSLDLPLKTAESGLAFTLNPELGFMTESGDYDLSCLAAAVNVSVSFPVAAGANATVVPFVSPGAGFGRVSGGGDSESGQRLLIGGGISIVNPKSGLQATASASKIFIENGATVFGIAIGIGR